MKIREILEGNYQSDDEWLANVIIDKHGSSLDDPTKLDDIVKTECKDYFLITWRLHTKKVKALIIAKRTGLKAHIDNIVDMMYPPGHFDQFK